MIWYRVGSRHERPGRTGISHLLEHMLFKGTRRFKKGEIDAITCRNGGANNAFTSLDYTAYYFTFASDRWWPALEIEADRMKNNVFVLEEFELERRVVVEELKMELESPWGLLRREVELNSFLRHPYRFPVIGLYDDLQNLKPKHLIRHYGTYYVPNNACLVVVGDFETDRLLSRIENLFGGLASGPLCEPENLSEPPAKRGKRLELENSHRVPRMIVSFPAPSIRQPEYFSMAILERLLAEGRLSRLYRRMIEQKGIASSVVTEFSETLDPYLFLIRLEIQEGRDPIQAEAMLFEEIEGLSRNGISVKELQRAKNQCLADAVGDFETTMDQAFQLGLLETLDRFEFWHHYQSRIESVRADEVAAAAQLYCAPERAVVGIQKRGDAKASGVAI